MMSKGYVPVDIAVIARAIRAGLDARTCQAIVFTQVIAAEANQTYGEVWLENANVLHDLTQQNASETWAILARAQELGLLVKHKQDDATVLTLNPVGISFAYRAKGEGFRTLCREFLDKKQGILPKRMLKTRRFLNIAKMRAVAREYETDGALDHVYKGLLKQSIDVQNEIEIPE